MQLGAYRLLQEIGRGGTAQVFVAERADDATRNASSDRVVLKRLAPSVAGDPRFVRMIEDEARALRALDHPSIPRFVGASDASASEPFVVMEHVDGPDVRTILGRMGQAGIFEVPLAVGVAIAHGVATALAAVHASPLGMVHRDVSASNVLVTLDGKPKLVDFGFALARDENRPPETAVGKTAAMSPEQIRGEKLDGRSDVFAAGILLFELTTGKRLFRGRTDAETALLVRDRDAVAPSQVRPGYPPALEDVVLRALARDRDRRTPSADRLREELEMFLGEPGVRRQPAVLAGFLAPLFANWTGARATR